ncbi:hypothetical protein XELAEV_18039679mg [Xenopus laevis]|uniref:Uncharacterized protein n=1 Tax=Xenopus laevis TaxID=8355 RepID=A0A974C824_XENLA|nr:hypothetical protein XELAEV_18039679mg [Xenopus laevis]
MLLAMQIYMQATRGECLPTVFTNEFLVCQLFCYFGYDRGGLAMPCHLFASVQSLSMSIEKTAELSLVYYNGITMYLEV